MDDVRKSAWLESCWHIGALEAVIAPRFRDDAGGGYVARPSDHGAVACRLAFSRQPRAQTPWVFRTHHLLHSALLEEMRAIVVREANGPGSASGRMRSVRDAV